MKRVLRHVSSPANIRSFLYFGDPNGRGFPGAFYAWQWLFNLRRSLLHKLQDGSSPEQTKQVAALFTEGILIRPFDDIFDKDGCALLDTIQAICKIKLEEPHVKDTLAGTKVVESSKNFILQLLGKNFEADSPFIQLAVHPKVLALVNAYLGMRSYLRDVQVWLNYPTPGHAVETQLWHRDYGDFLNVKIFIYLNDVTKQNGPFCFVPRTHRIGFLRGIAVRNAKGRIDDPEMAEAIPPEQWRTCVGSAKTVILCDTGGFHRGLKPLTGHRLLLELHYTSSKPAYPRTFQLKGSAKTFSDLDAVQKHALLL